MPGVPINTLPISTIYTDIQIYYLIQMYYLPTTYAMLKDFVNLQKEGTLRRWQPKHLFISPTDWTESQPITTMGVSSPVL